jgi:hypothetical protein
MAGTSYQASSAQRIAEAVRAACVRAALEAYEQAGLDGLCHEGAWEAAIEGIRALDVRAVAERLESGETGTRSS